MSEIKIAEMQEKIDIEDSNLIVIEDIEDTKRATILELKKAFSGDNSDPSEFKFYSSDKIQSLLSSIKILLNDTPSNKNFDDLKQQFNNIIASIGSDGSVKDPELIAARGNNDTLSDRFLSERNISDQSYINFPTKMLTGKTIDTKGYKNIPITLVISDSNTGATNTLSVSSRNSLNIDKNISISGVSYINNGIKITQSGSVISYTIATNNQLTPKVIHYLYSSISFGSTFKDTSSIELDIIYTDGTASKYNYNFEPIFEFTPSKPVEYIKFVFNSNNIVNGSTIEFANLMISTDPNLDEYKVPYTNTYTVTSGDILQLTTDEFIYSLNNGILTAVFNDINYTGDKIYDDIESLKQESTNTNDKCALLTNEGSYIFMDDCVQADTSRCTLSLDKDKIRNNHKSLKITLMDNDPDEYPRFTKILNSPLNLEGSSTISFQFYIDRTLFENFSNANGIEIYISSDEIISNPPINYYKYNIGKNKMIQGWNTFKIKISELTKVGSPSIESIYQINFKIYTNAYTSGKSLWFNSIIVDQMMKPTILLAFDGFYESGFNYQYPLLYTNNIPCTVFANDKTTFTINILEKIAKLHYTYGWDIGNDGCNPNKDIMISDDNPREQYMSVKNTMAWIIDNFTNDIVSYSAPYGNLRPITVPILNELGFKISKSSSDSYCSFFGKNDFTIPMHLMSNNTTIEELKKKIDYIIETGQTLCLYTNNVTQYGDEISCAKIMFETVLNYIIDKVHQDKVQCLTFKEFYNKCIIS